MHFGNTSLSLLWAVPFVGLLLTIATGPTLFRNLWHAHYGKIAAIWALGLVVPLCIVQGVPPSFEAVIHALAGEFLSFIVLLFALYVVAGGILVTGDLQGTPLTNTAILALGTLLASLVGTTGAAMILVRPLIRANLHRTQRAHVIVFFIILVANVGGALTPLGDPPLFVGFLHGVDFFWPLQHLWRQTAIVAGLILLVFIALETMLWRRERPRWSGTAAPLRVHGKVNLLLIGLVIATILVSTISSPPLNFDILGTPLALQNVARDAALLVIALISLWLTPREHRASNGFTWEPIAEVAKLFAAIFVCVIPVLAMLRAGHNGPFAALLAAVTTRDNLPNEAAYFWSTGLLSAFLDNAPTYLVFFELAGGNAAKLMGPLAGTLAAISLGAVFMGGLTYIGNAPNLMIRAMAEQRGIRMPSFFAYFGWAALLLLPLFVLLTVLPIPPILEGLR